METATVCSYHEVTAHAIPVPGDCHAVLQRFVRFILAVTGGTDVTFIADDNFKQTSIYTTTASGDISELTKASSEALGFRSFWLKFWHLRAYFAG